MSNTEQPFWRFLRTPVDQWQVSRVIGVDWYDGVTLGFVRFDNPRACFIFEMVGDGAIPNYSDILYRLHEFPTELFTPLEQLLEVEATREGIGQEGWWFFPVNSPNQEELDRLYAAILAARVPLPLLVESADPYAGFSRLWCMSSRSAGISQPIDWQSVTNAQNN